MGPHGAAPSEFDLAQGERPALQEYGDTANAAEPLNPRVRRLLEPNADRSAQYGP